MASFEVNKAHRLFPYKNFKFGVKFEGQNDYVSGVSSVSELTRTTNVLSHRDGNDHNTPHLQPGQSKIGEVTLQRGITHDPAFEEWANFVHTIASPKAVSLKNFRRNLVIDLFNLQHVVVRTYFLEHCWVSSYTALPELDANGEGVAFEKIVVQVEGFRREEVSEAAEE